MIVENWQAAWRQLIAPGSPYEVVSDGDGGPRAFRNAQPDLLTALNAGRAHGEREFVVWEDQRLTFAEARELGRAVGLGGDVALAWVLERPGVVRVQDAETPAGGIAWPRLAEVLGKALDELVASRATEGEAYAHPRRRPRLHCPRGRRRSSGPSST